MCGRHQPERGGGEARRRHGVSAGRGGVEGLSDSGAGVRRVWWRNGQVLTACRSSHVGMMSGFGPYHFIHFNISSNQSTWNDLIRFHFHLNCIFCRQFLECSHVVPPGTCLCVFLPTGKRCNDSCLHLLLI